MQLVDTVPVQSLVRGKPARRLRGFAAHSRLASLVAIGFILLISAVSLWSTNELLSTSRAISDSQGTVAELRSAAPSRQLREIEAEELRRLDSLRGNQNVTGRLAAGIMIAGALIGLLFFVPGLLVNDEPSAPRSAPPDAGGRSRIEQALEESEDRFRRLVESVKVIPWEWDPATGRYTYVGPQAVKALGYALEDWYADDFWKQHVHPEDREEAIAISRAAIQQGNDYELEYRMICADNRVVWMRDIVSVLPADGKPATVRGFTVDVSERKAGEEMLARQTADLVRSNNELEQFAYVASHDLQEPLRMVSSYTALLARRYRDRLDGDALEFIAFAQDGAARMQQLISDLLAYSRVSTRGADFGPVDPAAPLENALAHLKVAVEESGGEITHDALPIVLGDGRQLTQLFQNLIGNSLKFRGNSPARVHVSARQTESECVFAVADQGIGIDPQFAERIFVMFQRLHNRQEYPGTGIGLAICKKIVERHGGRIWVESQPGKGATFYFTMPKARKA